MPVSLCLPAAAAGQVALLVLCAAPRRAASWCAVAVLARGDALSCTHQQALHAPKLAPHHCQALLGPSGAGKSTLMDILAQRKSTGNLSGFLLVNGQPATSTFIRKTAYVPQVGGAAARGLGMCVSAGRRRAGPLH
jgi:hypothetical protein